jgi:WD40 repeat protein
VKGIGVADWVSLNHDGSLIAFGNILHHNRGITLYDVQSQTSCVIWDNKKYALGVAFHPFNSDYIACCDVNNIGLVNRREQKVLFNLSFEHNFASGIEFSNDGSKIYFIHSFFPEDKTPQDWDINKKGSYCVSEILIIDIETKGVECRIFLDNGIIHGTDFDIEHGLVALRYVGGKAEIWDLNKKICIQSVSHPHSSNCVIFVDEKTFLTEGLPTSDIDNVIMWDIATGKKIKQFNVHNMELLGMGIIYDKNGNKYVLSGNQHRRAKLWSLDTGEVIWSKKYGCDIGVATSGDCRRGVIRTEKDPVIVEFNFARAVDGKN